MWLALAIMCPHALGCWDDKREETLRLLTDKSISPKHRMLRTIYPKHRMLRTNGSPEIGFALSGRDPVPQHAPFHSMSMPMHGELNCLSPLGYTPSIMFRNVRVAALSLGP